MKRRLLALSLCAALLLPPSPARGAEAPSDWAANAVTWLQGTGKLTEADFTGYDRTVTRADFARLGVILYELITGMPKPDPASDYRRQRQMCIRDSRYPPGLQNQAGLGHRGRHYLLPR